MNYETTDHNTSFITELAQDSLMNSTLMNSNRDLISENIQFVKNF